MKTKDYVSLNLDTLSEVIDIIVNEKNDGRIIDLAEMECRGIPFSLILSIIHKTKDIDVSYIYFNDEIFAYHRRNDLYTDIYWFKIENENYTGLTFNYSDIDDDFNASLILAITISHSSDNAKNSYSITEDEYFNIIKNNSNDKLSVLNNIIPRAAKMYMDNYDSPVPIYTNPFLVKMVYNFNNVPVVFEKELYDMHVLFMHE